MLRVYVDETGDRGTSARSSPFFAFAAVLIPDEDEAAVRAVVHEIRSTLKVPPSTALHWNRHVKTFARRQYVTGRLRTLPQLSAVYVFVDKATRSYFAKKQQCGTAVGLPWRCLHSVHFSDQNSVRRTPGRGPVRGNAVRRLSP
ncbi:hypothetical protein GCM10022247_15950 [Allokutzneria multivorans]|uniref:DUF3800 domain-containing protein n=1 Tax=Allokutzneria multivorans TaxID=1142134 RepID=A0ABP7RFK9_9PSEU